MKTVAISSRSTLLAALIAFATGPALSAGAMDAGTAPPSGGQDKSAAASSTSGGSQPAASKSAGGKTGTGAKAPVVVLFPLEVITTDSTIKNGCWAKIYDHDNYSGDSLTLIGPTALADMTGPYGLNWDDRVHSIEVGPKTRVTVFDNQGFRDQVAQFQPGQKVADLSKRMGFFDEFASIKLDCTQG